MKNIFVWIINKNGGYKFKYIDNQERIYNYLRLQIHNSIEMGWKKEDIIPITNFEFDHMGVKANVFADKICDWSSFANRMVVVNHFIKEGLIEEDFWIHDLDAYQLLPFVFPKECKDVGFCRHAVGRNKPQGASAFYRKTAFDIIEAKATLIKLFKPKQEESFFPVIYNKKLGQEKANKYRAKYGDIVDHFGKYENRFCFLDFTYNLCQQRMFDRKYPLAEKPIKVVHFKLEDKSTLNCFYKGLNKFSVRIVDERLANLFFKYNLVNEKDRVPYGN